MKAARPWVWVVRNCIGTFASAGLTSACWVLWLLLGGLAALLATVYFKSEVGVPDFLLRRIEQKLEFAQLTARFGRTSINPRGHLLLENVQICGRGIQEPLFQAGSIRVHIDIWAVIWGDFDIRQVDIADARLDCPALVSRSGISEPVLSRVGGTIRHFGDRWHIHDLSGKIGPVFTMANIEWESPSAQKRRQLPQGLLREYVETARRLSGMLRYGDLIEGARLRLDIQCPAGKPSRIHADFSADSVSIPLGRGLAPAVAKGVSVEADAALRPGGLDPVSLWATATSIEGPEDVAISRPAVRTSGHLSFNPLRWHGSEAEFAAASLERLEDKALYPRATLSYGLLPELRVKFAALAGGSSPVDLQLDIDTAAGTGVVDFRGKLAAALLNNATARAAVWRKSRILAELSFLEPVTLAARARLGAGWRPVSASATLDIGAGIAYGVALDHTEGEFTIDSHRLRLDHVVLRRQDADVRGSYEMDTRTLDYRFLLQGYFYPDTIDPWFSEWWPRLWSDFDFGPRQPRADIDIIGRWQFPEYTKIYGYADAEQAALRTVPTDTLHAEFFVRPEHYDIGFHAVRGAQSASGGFICHDDSETKLPRWISFDFRSTLPLQDGARLFGPEGEKAVAAYECAEPPDIRAAGRIWWDPEGRHENIQGTITVPGACSFHHFPLQQLKVAVSDIDNQITLDPITAGVADGQLSGAARITGPDTNRQLSFAGKLANADLVRLVQCQGEYEAKNTPQGTAPISLGVTSLGSQGRIDIELAAAGPLGQMHSLQGAGTATVRNAEIAKINLFGAFSRMLSGTFLGFTSLHLTDAEARFNLNRENIDFTSLKITGPSAALSGKGRFTLTDSSLRFNLAFFPFKENSFPVFNLLGTVLSPLSYAFEARLAGTMAKPEWSLAVGAGSPLPRKSEPPPPMPQFLPTSPAPPPTPR